MQNQLGPKLRGNVISNAIGDQDDNQENELIVKLLFHV
jgi:hypothetical protein